MKFLKKKKKKKKSTRTEETCILIENYKNMESKLIDNVGQKIDTTKLCFK